MPAAVAGESLGAGCRLGKVLCDRYESKWIVCRAEWRGGEPGEILNDARHGNDEDGDDAVH